jgi:Arc/MetJ-type ribon-helix-helix transcriptional regulator
MNQAGDALIVRAPADSDYVKHGKPQIVRYDLHNHFEAQIAAHMTTGSSVAYVFEYTVANTTASRDDIQTWRLIIPAKTGDQPRVSGQDDWGGATSVPAIFRNVELPDQPLGRVAVWVQDSAARKIGPGRSETGFRVESNCKPGFTTALLGSGILVNIDQDLPDEVFRQMDFYNDPTWGKASVLTFGPMFCSAVPRQQIIQNMISGINRSIATNKVSSRSEFVREALEQLKTMPESGPARNAAFTHAPTSEFEQEIFTALRLSLSFAGGQ